VIFHAKQRDFSPVLRSCLNLIAEILHRTRDAACTTDEVIAMQRRSYEKLMPVFK